MNFLTSIKWRLLIGFLAFLIISLIIAFIPIEELTVKIIISLLFLGGSAFFGSFLLERFLLAPIRQFIIVSNQIAQHDLSQSLDIHTKDEFEILAQTVDEMLRNLRSILQENLDAAEQLALAASEMSKMAQDAHSSTLETTDTMDNMAKATEEQFENIRLSVLASQQMAETAQQVAQEAQQAATHSSQAAEHARSGGEIIQDVHSKMNQLKESVDSSAEVVRKLGDRSLEIGKIVDVMRGISRQTNLLALNAAIEAARAGEHGRGFSVVADEVRALAEQSTNSAIQIVALINEIQQETKDAVEAMEIGTKVVEEGAMLALSAKESFTEITTSVNQTVNTIHEIAAASQEQAASSEEMTSTMQRVASISNQNVGGAKQVASIAVNQRQTMERLNQSSARLVGMADHLTALVGRFKLKSNMQRCWRVLDCSRVDCPAYQSKEEKCWLIQDTLGPDGTPQGSPSEKRAMCHQCDVFKINTNQ